MSDSMTLHIVIDGKSAEELFAAGPIDMKDYFLPDKLGVRSEDVKEITFRKVTERTEFGVPTREIHHKDNYVRSVTKA